MRQVEKNDIYRIMRRSKNIQEFMREVVILVARRARINLAEIYQRLNEKANGK